MGKKEKDEMSEILKNQKGVEQNVLGLPVDRDFLFSNHKDIYKKGTEKRQTKLFEKISFIKPFLKEGERILLVTRKMQLKKAYL